MEDIFKIVNLYNNQQIRKQHAKFSSMQIVNMKNDESLICQIIYKMILCQEIYKLLTIFKLFDLIRFQVLVVLVTLVVVIMGLKVEYVTDCFYIV